MSSSANWVLKIDHGVFKALKKIPKHNAKAVLSVIQLLPFNPYFGDIKKMKGEDNVWRRRAGDYRVFYKVKVADKIILVFHLERRTSKTY